MLRNITVSAVVLASLAACGPGEAPKTPERVVNVTTAPVARKDLPVTESAVGQETAIGQALDYDPTRVGGGVFHVRLPFPEHVAARLKIGQTVTLTAFSGGPPAQGAIRDIRPALNATTLTRDVIVRVSRQNWRPLGSIRGEVVLGTRQDSLVVPEQAVVLRRSGTVVYLVGEERVEERAVRTGIVREGVIEIVEGLKGGETVVVDGAALLSDKAKIKVRDRAA